jgi:hypothetical protein
MHCHDCPRAVLFYTVVPPKNDTRGEMMLQQTDAGVIPLEPAGRFEFVKSIKDDLIERVK